MRKLFALLTLTVLVGCTPEELDFWCPMFPIAPQCADWEPGADNPEPPAANLRVITAAQTPQGQVVLAGTQEFEVFTLKLTAANEDILLEDLTISINGLIDDQALRLLRVYDEGGRLLDDQIFAENGDFTLTFADALHLSAEDPVFLTFEVNVDFSAEGGDEFLLCLETAEWRDAATGEGGITEPENVCGNRFTVAAQGAFEIMTSPNTPEARLVITGETDVHGLTSSASAFIEDTTLEYLIVDVRGFANNGTIQNLRVLHNGEQIGFAHAPSPAGFEIRMDHLIPADEQHELEFTFDVAPGARIGDQFHLCVVSVTWMGMWSGIEETLFNEINPPCGETFEVASNGRVVFASQPEQPGGHPGGSEVPMLRFDAHVQNSEMIIDEMRFSISSHGPIAIGDVALYHTTHHHSHIGSVQMVDGIADFDHTDVHIGAGLTSSFMLALDVFESARITICLEEAVVVDRISGQVTTMRLDERDVCHSTQIGD